MAVTHKKKSDGMLAFAKYLLTLIVVVGIGYGGYLAQQQNDRTTADLRARCGIPGGSVGLTNFGTCR
ncbi:MAG: hypothetical protein AB7G06_09165 [Bdellovibrionales bacterium]